MFKSVQMRVRTVATLGVMAALVVGGVAAAQSGSPGSSSGGGSGEGQSGQPHGMPGGPPPGMMMGPGTKGLTYGELHVQKDGNSEVIRLDQGKVTAVDSSSITVEENDGSEVTVALDENTKIIAGPPDEKSPTDDLENGQQVFISGPEGEPADSVMVAPKRGQLPKGAPHGGQMPPPPLGS
jgi:antitoxin component of MazEF toxin-antitoxin module